MFSSHLLQHEFVTEKGVNKGLKKFWLDTEGFGYVLIEVLKLYHGPVLNIFCFAGTVRGSFTDVCILSERTEQQRPNQPK